ncbi:uncharacterized protein LOC126582640 [Malus sylvestris]|uniref:uncharacterized protein LOC126582640 n=1 Tax=Malus sylvestris TaxID=3752 RepID=UPI0021ACB045|nr:uncharacterized protein LOC126582640 [Malus sylvestris]
MRKCRSLRRRGSSLSPGRKRMRTCAGSMETRTTPITRSGTRALVAEASNLCTRIASCSGSITTMLANARHLCELGGQDVNREDEEERNGARATRRAPGQANRNFVGDVNGEDAAGAQGIAGAGQMIRRNAENVAARWEMQAARLEAHVEQCLMVWMMLMAPRMYRLMSLGFLALPRSLRLCKTLVLF